MPFTPPTECPVCGADVPRGAKACPECGADERSGWNEDATRYDGLDLPDAAFDDDNTRSRTRPRPRPSAPNNLSWLWWLAGIVLIALLVSQVLF